MWEKIGQYQRKMVNVWSRDVPISRVTWGGLSLRNRSLKEGLGFVEPLAPPETDGAFPNWKSEAYHTVDGCEILHQLVDGLSHYNTIIYSVSKYQQLPTGAVAVVFLTTAGIKVEMTIKSQIQWGPKPEGFKVFSNFWGKPMCIMCMYIYIILYYIIMTLYYYIISYDIILYYIVLYYIISYYIILYIYHIISYYIILYYIIYHISYIIYHIISYHINIYIYIYLFIYYYLIYIYTCAFSSKRRFLKAIVSPSLSEARFNCDRPVEQNV